MLEQLASHVVKLVLSCLRLLVIGEQFVAKKLDKKDDTSTTTVAKSGQSSATSAPHRQVAPTTYRVDPGSLQQVNMMIIAMCISVCCVADGHGVLKRSWY